MPTPEVLFTYSCSNSGNSFTPKNTPLFPPLDIFHSIDSSKFEYFDKISNMNLNNPSIVGFGISNRETYQKVIEKSKGAIIGSAFINFIEQNGIEYVGEFIKKFR